MWGQVNSFLIRACHNGIIPTRVGTREINQACSSLIQDHPHACGDKVGTSEPLVDVAGSSPRVWGQVKQDVRDHFP